MTQKNDLNAPWSLHFDRDGTEDIAVISDTNGEDLVHSRHFWLPEGDDPIPPTLAAVRLMVVAPKLLAAAKAALTALELILEVDDPAACTQIEWEAEPLAMLRRRSSRPKRTGGRYDRPRLPRNRGATSTARTPSGPGHPRSAAESELPAFEVFDAEGDKVFDTNEDSPCERQEANARLASTAPRLLAALITCANLLADYDESDGEGGEAHREARQPYRKPSGGQIDPGAPPSTVSDLR